MDVIISLNGHELTQFDDFYNFLAGMSRPLTIQLVFHPTFLLLLSLVNYRLHIVRFYRAKSKSFYGSGTAGTGGMTSIFKNITGNNAQSKPTTSISEEEKKARREMMSNAAKERSQQWDKKTGGGKSKPATSPRAIESNITPNDAVTNPETLRVIQKTKEYETKVEQVRL